MSGLLLDENMPQRVARALRARDDTLAVRTVGDGIAPPLGTPDPELLRWIEEWEFVLLTNNRRSMPVHLAAHLATGHHVPGVLQVPEEYRLGPLADEVVLVLGASLAGELADQITYLQLP